MPRRGPEPQDKSEEIVDVLRQHPRRSFMGTGELADALGYESNPGVKKHLQRAVDKGKIEKATVSGYDFWYLPDTEELPEIETPPPGGGGPPPETEKPQSTSLSARFAKKMEAIFPPLHKGISTAKVYAIALTIATAGAWPITTIAPSLLSPSLFGDLVAVMLIAYAANIGLWVLTNLLAVVHYHLVYAATGNHPPNSNQYNVFGLTIGKTRTGMVHR